MNRNQTLMRAFRDRRLASCSTDARWLYGCLLSLAEIDGNLRFSYAYLREEIFGHEGHDLIHVFLELQEERFIMMYRSSDQWMIYLPLRGYSTPTQKEERPSATILPFKPKTTGE